MVTIAVGTEKGGFLLDEDGGVAEPFMPGWKVTAFGRSGGHHLAAVGSNWFGVGIHRSDDLSTWTQTESPPSHDDPERSISQVWTFHDTPDGLYAGVADASLFRSDDHGLTWTGVDGFNDHRTRDEWMPGLGGLCAHRVLTGTDGHLWVGASAVGVFRSRDGGATFDLVNDGVDPAGVPEDTPRPEVGYCVHGMVAHPDDPETIWRQEHTGVYRTTDGGDHWERIEHGLPAGFGFAIAREGSTGRLFVAPLQADEQRLPVDGRFAVHRSDDDGESWQEAGDGWPDAPTYTSVLRGAIDADDDGRVVVGTTSGQVWWTEDAGDSWRRHPATFPRIGAIALW